MRRWSLVVVASFAVLAPGRMLEAQRPISLGVAGGVSVPQGDLADGANTGWHALGTLALGSAMQPIGLRLDVAYNRFGFSDRVGTTIRDGHQSIGSATLNASYRLPMTNSPISPYLIAGLGAYRSDCSLGAVSCDAVTRFGWNAGLGARMRVLPFRTFVELRYHRTSGIGYVPVTVGVML
jgi:opacity protein-like surface antigen